ncbi:class I SAM-dependent methyltransferase [Coriobacteriia bacterium Es71-Z0120]|jgi:ubiquinone/menaquinone biosynthesis C-methylase UbiE|uniref:class I SAM-dependent methyltransferase n=1 Tax=Parvivirga hydrogeniphila TaxID=2939460 RepID=UPI002260C47F|nr:class I SAM-dependent methyltransferase [Parvivirga hydrogeniphila]MCL4078672.1 class I SAM-dependent methyltransferase [Parvivirga hydrogeniphila]
MAAHRFDPKKLPSLNDVARLEDLVPDAIWDAFGVPDARVAIEVGAGTGMFAREFAARMAPESVVYAVDAEPAMTAWMREHLIETGGARIEVVDARAEELPFGKSVADLLYMINLHHELDDVDAALSEAMRVLRPGGTIGVVDWKREPTPKGPPVEHRAGAETIARDLERAGFADVRAVPVLRYHDIVVALRPLG